MDSFIAIIPARYASTRFPGKPLVDIDGKPMIQHVYERVSEFMNYVYVASDDERIRSCVESFGGRCVMTSGSHRSGTDRCAEALGTVEAQLGRSFDVVVNIQGDEPFLAAEHLEKIMGAFANRQTQIATLVKRFGAGEDIFNPNSPKVVFGKDGFALYFSRSVIPYLRGREAKEWNDNCIYYKHIGLYAYRSAILREITCLPAGVLEQAESLEQLRWLENGYKIYVAETDTETLAIDTPDDLERVLHFLRKK